MRKDTPHKAATEADTDAARKLLDQLLADSRLYKQSQDYKDMLDFVVRLRNFAPFNAMLLQIQKPGLSYAASARDWRERFGRYPKEGARPLVILWPFGPVAFVYDILDTEGKDFPKDVNFFPAKGLMTKERIQGFVERMERKNINCIELDAGDRNAGSIRTVFRPRDLTKSTIYRMQVNGNHFPVIQFATVVHELGHLFLGHLGPDKVLNIPHRYQMGHAQMELEAESVSFLVCARHGITSKSETYLADYVAPGTTINHIDIYQVMRAAGQVESLLGIAAHTRFDQPKKGEAVYSL